jgi:hypothetical protein
MDVVLARADHQLQVVIDLLPRVGIASRHQE